MNAPLISVVIATRGRAPELERCLLALSAQTVASADFEVVVCDDGSDEPIAGALAPVLAEVRGKVGVRLMRQDHSGPAVARNRGAAVAAGRWLAFTDDDCSPAPDWLERLLARFAASPDALIGGGLCTPSDAAPCDRATQQIMDFVYHEQERRGGMRLFSTSNLAISADAFHRLGGFSPAFGGPGGEDYDLCARWQARGGAVVNAPEARVVHEHGLTLVSYCRQHFGYGRGLVRMRSRLRQQGVDVKEARRQSRPLNAVYYLRLVAAPWRARGVRGTSSVVLIALAQAATALGGLREAVRRVRGPASRRAPDAQADSNV